MKILLFGTGDYYNRYKKWFGQQEIVALLDNSRAKQHTVIDGIEVLSPEEGIRQDYDIIIVLSFYVQQMKQQLISLGVDKNRIYHFYDMHGLFAGNVVRRPMQYFLNAEELIKCDGAYKILLLSNDLSLGGPAIALLHAARVLKRYGYLVVYAAMTDGPLKSVLIEHGIPVIVDENLQISTMQESDWVTAFSLLVCNTLNFHVFLSERYTLIPVIWWLHDARFFYDGVNKETIGRINREHLKAVSVGPIPAKALKEFLPDIKCEELLYGVEDMEKRAVAGKRSNGKMVFVTIGFLEDIKGQDLLIQAVSELDGNIRQQCQFYIVGHNETLFGERMRMESEIIEEITFTGSFSRTQIHELLESSSFLVCPSRQDSMPTVAAEAMMHSVPCILSDATGTAAYIHDGEDGFVFHCDDVQALIDKIVWCVTNKEQLCRIGKEARKLYEEYFSMSAFEKRFMRMIRQQENSTSDQMGL